MSDTAGLIDPDKIPRMRAWLISGAATTVRGLGDGVKSEMGDVNTEWQKLRACYEAPEQEDVYGLLRPAVNDAADFQTRMSSAASALDTFAARLSELRPRFEELRTEARTFRNSVINGVERPVIVPGSEYSYMAEPIYETVPWYDDHASLTTNRHLVGRVNELAAELSEAEATCADAINAQLEYSCVAPATSYTADQLHGADSLPWGYAREYESKNCVESIGLGLGDIVVGAGEGLGGLFLGYDPDTGEWFQGDQYAQSWGGLGNLALSLVVVTTPGITTTAAIAGLVDPGNSYSAWVQERGLVTANAVTSLVNINLYSDDPFAAWKEDGVRAATSGIGNIATFFIPGANVANTLKIGGTAGKVTNILANSLDNLVPGTALAMNGAIRVTGFGVRATDNLAGVTTTIGGKGAVNAAAQSIDLGAGATRASMPGGGGLPGGSISVPKLDLPPAGAHLDLPNAKPDVGGAPAPRDWDVKTPETPSTGARAPEGSSPAVRGPEAAAPEAPGPKPDAGGGPAPEAPGPKPDAGGGPAPEAPGPKPDAGGGPAPEARSMDGGDGNTRATAQAAIDAVPRVETPVGSRQTVDDVWKALDEAIDVEPGQVLLDGEFVGLSRPEDAVMASDYIRHIDGTPSPSGYTNNGYVPDPSAMAPELREFLDTHPQYRLDADGVIRPAEPIYVEVNPPTSSHPYEHYRQAAEQQATIRDYEMGDLLDNLNTYDSASSIVRDARATGRDIGVQELKATLMDQFPHMSEAEINDVIAAQKGDTAATHRLDGVGGGDVTDISGLGHRGANSSLGGKWNWTSEALYHELADVYDAIPAEFRGDVRPNIVFVVKP